MYEALKTWGNTEVVWDFASGGGYEWEIVAIVRREVNGDLQYAVYSDGGCSCNHEYQEGPETYDLEWSYNLQDVKRKASQEVRQSSYSDVAERATALSEISKL